MQQLATAIRENIDLLADRYDASLRNRPGYDRLPEALRRELEQRVLDLIAQCLQTADHTALVQYVQQRAVQWEAMGLPLAWFQQALVVPEEILTPLIRSVEAGNFLWQALNRSQGAVWQMVADHAHQAEERFRSIVETSHSGVLIIDDAFHLTYVNDELARISGYTREELLGADFRQLLDEESRQIVADRYIRRQRGEDVSPRYEVAFLRKDGAKRYIEMSAVTLAWADGTKHTVAQVLDVTEQKQAETTLRENESRLRAIYEGSNDAIMLLNEQGFFDCNIQTLKLFNVDSKEAFTRLHPSDLSPAYQPDGQDSLTASQQRIQTALQQGYNRFEWVHRRMNGEEFPAEVLLSAFAYGGEHVLQATVRDITERKRLELQIRESLTRRDVQVQTSTEVAQEIAAAPEVSELFHRVVTLIKERFNYYHAQLFRYDPAQDAVVLIAGYGEVGDKMLATGHSLPMGRGVVGTAADTGQSILAADVTQDEDWRPNPHLPETKGELAVPIKLRDEVLGILDVQSDRIGALTDDDRLLLEGLCGQIAIVMESTRLLEQLRRNEAQLTEALKIARLGYWEYDVERDLFLFNDQFYSIFHTTAEQAGGYQLSSAQYAQQFVHPDDLPLVGTEIEKALNSTDRHYNRQLEHRILYADGGIGHISVNVNIDRDEQGRILRYYGANQDITERKQIEQALAQEQSLMHALMDTVTDHIYFKDLQSRFLRISKSQADRFGLSAPAQATGKTDFDFFTEEHARPAYEDEQEIIRTGRPITKEERETWSDRPDTWVLTSKFPLRDEASNIVGTFGISVNITTRRQAEVEREHLLADQQRRTVQLQTASEVSRAASSILNLDDLLPQTAELICTRFNFYYVGIFLTDDVGRWAILRAGTGGAGQQMLANGHKLRIGGNSMISQCIETQRAQIALDVGEEAVRFDNPLLPLTRSEMALPLISRGRIIGAVTIQSDQPAAFTADDITVLQSMADQISNAVENARLYEQAQTALQEVDAINRRLTGEAWETYLRQQVGREVIWLADDESAAPEPLSQLDESLTTGQITIEPDPEDQSEATVTAPILLRGQPIGALRMRTPLSEWSDDTEVVLADIAGHIAQAVENARLVEQTQRTAQREKLINEINARVRQSVDLDTILRTAVNELGQSLKAARVVVRVGTTAAEGAAAAAGDGRGKTND